MDIQFHNIEQIPTAILNAYQSIHPYKKSLEKQLHLFWNKGGQPEATLWKYLTEHALNWQKPIGFEAWPFAISLILQQVSDPHQRLQYHSRLVALLAPLMPLPKLLTLRDLHIKYDTAVTQRWYQEITESMTLQPHEDIDDEEEESSLKFSAFFQIEELRKEIQLFIETQLQDYSYSQDALNELLNFPKADRSLVTYSLQGWFHWSSIWLIDQWVDRGLFDRYLWWDRFLDSSSRIESIRRNIASEAGKMIEQHWGRFIATLAGEPDALDAFFSTCSTASARRLATLDHTPFQRDETLWLQLATHTVPRGMIPKRISQSPQRPSHESLFNALWPAFQKSQDTATAYNIAIAIAPADMSREDRKTLIQHCFDLSRGGREMSEYKWSRVLESVRDGEVICELLALEDTELRLALLNRYKKQKHANWEPLYPFAQQYPELIVKTDPWHIDFPLWRMMWQRQSDVDRCREWVAWAILNQMNQKDQEPQTLQELAAFLNELASEDAKPFEECLDDTYIHGYRSFQPSSLALLWALHLPDIDPLILPILAGQHNLHRASQGPKLARDVLLARPDDLLALKTAAMNLFPIMDQLVLESLAPQLLNITRKSAAKDWRDALAGLFANFEPDLVGRLGWMDGKPTKNVCQACLEILIQHPHPNALAQLRTLYDIRNLDQASKDRILSHLEAKGESVAELDTKVGTSLDDLVALAAKLKKVSKAVEAIYRDELAALLPDVPPELVRWMLHQLATDKSDGILRSVNRIMQACPPDHRHRFNGALLHQWLSSDGDPKLSWLLRLLPYGADDRLVAPLLEAVKTWHKKRKQRAVYAIEALASMDTTYALSQVKLISENTKYKPMLINAALQALREAAARRQQSVVDFYDELVPDFGLGGEGIALDVGPYAYHLELQNDLSMLVRGPNGKTTKSLPKAKPEEDEVKRAEAEETIKQVRAGIKTVGKQQEKRLHNALFAARSWAVARWRHLFVDHLFMRHTAQRLIWSRQDAEGNPLGTFRLSEDLSLIDHQDDVVELQDHDLISLWHPIQSDEETVAGWRQHLDDYAITPLIEQVNQPCLTLKPEWLKNTEIIAYQGYAITRSKLVSKMSQWGYFTGPVEDGPSIHMHSLRLAEAHMMIELYHTGMDPYFMSYYDGRIAIRQVRLYPIGAEGKAIYGLEENTRQIDPQHVSPVTMSMLLAQIQELAQSGEGYEKNWKNL